MVGGRHGGKGIVDALGNSSIGSLKAANCDGAKIALVGRRDHRGPGFAQKAVGEIEGIIRAANQVAHNTPVVDPDDSVIKIAQGGTIADVEGVDQGVFDAAQTAP